jgi:hypothetical protein
MSCDTCHNSIVTNYTILNYSISVARKQRIATSNSISHMLFIEPGDMNGSEIKQIAFEEYFVVRRTVLTCVEGGGALAESTSVAP